MGEHKMKNIERPVHVYRVLFDGVERSTEGAPVPEKDTASTPPKADGDFAKTRGRASIIVLPFSNLGKGEDESWLAEGITEDLIIEISRFKSLEVIARNTAEQYAGKKIEARTLRDELGVDFVLEGTIRRGGSRCRIAVTLTDAVSGKQVWAEKYDHTIDDMFEVQDQITQTLTGILPIQLEVATAERARKKPTESMEAYELLLRGRIHHHRNTSEDNKKATELLARAIELDPDLAQAHAWSACVLGQACVRGYTDDFDKSWNACLVHAEKSQALASDDSECYRISAEVHLQKKAYDDAESSHNRAFELNPNDPRILSQRGELHIWRGDPEGALEWIEKAIKRDPRDADRRAGTQGLAYLMMGRPKEAIPLLKKNSRPNPFDCGIRAAAFAADGDKECAARARKKALEAMPSMTATLLSGKMPFEKSADRQKIKDLLLAAGFPEE
jgi:adenylate cyclase